MIKGEESVLRKCVDGLGLKSMRLNSIDPQLNKSSGEEKKKLLDLLIESMPLLIKSSNITLGALYMQG